MNSCPLYRGQPTILGGSPVIGQRGSTYATFSYLIASCIATDAEAKLYPTANLPIRRTNFAGNGYSNRQVMLIGLLPVWLTYRAGPRK